ncbi:diacylglycerol/lipid kinase family protein [Cellulomonas gilvus]|uniref:Diacylglycerol kinase catalytic region n=1 Tax=Cellulomonas gilvus (strain ATCC 13127 / NRRL B-14078) TaxID=593907 RepID=F8A3E1_CELGA|nr:diacylglycerol kinase family protein [Cellulomonas gilvus]AEI10705.1 diacylglycerol kinase catalytic region [Cellulomonas gilvus ATCC 13127]
MGWHEWAAVAVGLAVVVGLLVALVTWARRRDLLAHLNSSPATGTRARALGRDARERGQLIAFVANPSKPDVPALRDAVERATADQGLPAPLWLETTVEDPGRGQARAALAQGADLVVAIGGDGTVRAVAEVLTGTHVAMAIVPLGTGNLLARNLDLPIGDPFAALEVAVRGADRAIDVGWLRVLRYDDEEGPREPRRPTARRAPDAAPAAPRPRDERDHLFLVIAGLGFDAAMVADADDGLKARMGWVAYFVAGIRHLHGRRNRVHVRIDDQPTTSTRLRSLLIGNCGRLPGGLTLLPDAVVDDGWLDVAAIDTRAGIAGWAQLFGEVVLQGVGVKNGRARGIGRIDHTRARDVRVVVPAGEYAQVDGDIVGRVTEVTARVDPGALVVRVAAPA